MTQQRILMVENDQDLGQIMFQFLQGSQFQTEWLKEGEQVIFTVKRQPPDLILMDVTLPDINGIELTRQIRAISDIPIVIVTAKSDEMSRLIGLQAGADDYVCKPFSAPELLLRIKAILRRTASSSLNQALQTDDQPEKLMLNESRLTVSFEAREEKISYTEYCLLKLLTQNPHRIYKREQIINLVYESYREISDRTVDSHIRNLRKKLASIGADRAAIESVYGVGYRFVESSTITELD